MDKQRQDDQLEPIYNSSVPIQDVALKIYRERWTIEKGGERGSGRSMQAARHDDDDCCSIYTGCTQYLRRSIHRHYKTEMKTFYYLHHLVLVFVLFC